MLCPFSLLLTRLIFGQILGMRANRSGKEYRLLATKMQIHFELEIPQMRRRCPHWTTVCYGSAERFVHTRVWMNSVLPISLNASRNGSFWLCRTCVFIEFICVGKWSFWKSNSASACSCISNFIRQFFTRDLIVPLYFLHCSVYVCKYSMYV